MNQHAIAALRPRRAKILATVGPASRSPEMLRRLFLAGVDTFRLNFSHGSHDDHRAAFDAIRALEAEFDQPIGILQDLQGPKIRIGQLAGGPIPLTAGDMLTLTLDGADGTIPLPHPEIFDAVQPGHQLLIDDGRIRLEAVAHDAGSITARVVAGGRLQDRKGVNLPDTVVDLPALTAKDRDDLEFGMSLGVDWVALSFVQRPEDLELAKALIQGRAGLIAKIEKPSALLTLPQIVAGSDGIMIARGDLGVEIPPEEVPGRQKEIIRLCRQMDRPVIVATQMLESMTGTPTPTRAEASDVATAIYDGADAVMLSAETASGQYPAEAVDMMDRIIRRTEAHPFYAASLKATAPDAHDPHQAIAEAAVELAGAIAAPALVAFSSTGASGLRIASHRAPRPTVLLTADLAVARRMALVWGIRPLLDADVTDHDSVPIMAEAAIAQLGIGQSGQSIVVVCGFPFGVAGTTNSLRVTPLGQTERETA
ncbi:pyruvate kinase [Paracoccus laeviglucosivorans]|uniref:Pyruvate kinase n=1 Tax=Paracoccus laeviglucosivorans TaxID=1197861 RepID=A0A521FF51_9RHOB|nr:pyruvate kinase [Paracoccus laeviglucosivorans]SMO94759.1 pyruvate kinase [Paracoccus laeviglucosivorans]